MNNQTEEELLDALEVKIFDLDTLVRLLRERLEKRELDEK